MNGLPGTSVPSTNSQLMSSTDSGCVLERIVAGSSSISTAFDDGSIRQTSNGSQLYRCILLADYWRVLWSM